MPSLTAILAVAALSVGLALTPGPNLLYLVSRSLAQGTRAGMVSLAGCVAGTVAIMLAAALGVAAALLALPYGFDVLRLGGAAYLGWMAWQCLKPGAAPIFAPRPLPRESDAKLFSVGLATAALNPKVALFYVAVLPAFLDPSRGGALSQIAVLGLVQIGINAAFDALFVLGAARVSAFLGSRPAWVAAQRWVLGGALGLLAVKLATTER
ncbi:LysE family translocator [Roseomonas sp. OT10]|uniref:LysE family translocator n=1 Tax=Roseomonas cutis TaxID=2897332 RepID=UPI001E2F3442|nr:LysE family translocator [Roseomonas sp. OT10]UFN49544.1 LysE family translocator [Roseomonas sp. OT10]